MKKYIVTTTINPITKALKAFQQMSGWELIVVGDKKTPENFKLEKGEYVTPDMQEKYDKKLSDAIGWNCIQRRNIGYLWAYDRGADIIATVDDDNIPLEHWGENLFVGKDIEVNYFNVNCDAFDPVGATNYPQLWHRGFPLQLISQRDYRDRSKKIVHVDIQADFWNGDPDIDAVCRMVFNPVCEFDSSAFPMSSNAPSPFNSQNTFLSREVLKDYFLFPGIGRMDDIWAAYYVESLGKQVVYMKPTVFQERNVHDLTKDMKAEYLGYEHNATIVSRIQSNPNSIFDLLPDNAKRSFELYQKHFT